MKDPRFNQWLIALALGLVLSTNAWAQRIKGTQEVQPYGYAELFLEGIDKTPLWRVYPEPIQKATDKVGVLRFGGIPGTTYRVEVIIIDFDKKTVSEENTTVVFRGGAPPPPIPPPDIPPGPLPTDPFVAALQKSYELEMIQDRSTMLVALRTVYADAVKHVDMATTWGQLFDMMLADAEKLKVAGKALNMQKIIQQYLMANLPITRSAPIDAAGKDKAKAAFRTITKALEQVK